MRAFFITLVLLAAIGGGGYYYWREHPEAFATESAASAPPAPDATPTPEAQAARVESCTVQNARYESRGNRGLKFRFAATPENFAASGPGAAAYDAPALLLVATSGERSFRFAAATTTGAATSYLFPAANEASVVVPAAADLQVSVFDSDLNYLAALPRLDAAAPKHIFAPNLGKYLAEQGGEPRIEAPISMIDFVYCDESRAPAPARPPASQM